MNKREISELARRWKPEKCAVSRIYGCYVSGPGGRVVTDMDESLGRMPQEEVELYLGFLKKTLSGTLGRNLIDIVFSTKQVQDSDEHRLLMDLKNSALQNSEARHIFYQKVIDCLEMEEESYLILMAADAYDVPRRGKSGAEDPDASDQVFSYFLCAICPVKENKASLGYFPGDNEFHCSGGHTAAAPELGFLFPAFDDRAANIYNALFYAKKPDQIHQEFIDAIFCTEPPLSAADQRESFQSALTEALGEACSLDVVQGVHEQLTEKIAEHKESRDPEPLALTAGDVGKMLRECGVEEEHISAFEDQVAVALGEGASLSPANLVDAGKFEVKTAEARLIVDPECAYVVESRVIDGRRYILFPAGDGVEVNGIPVRFDEEAEKDGEPGKDGEPKETALPAAEQDPES